MASASAFSAPPRFLHRAWNIAWWTVRAFFSDNVPRLGAALAFYTTIAMAPLLVLAIAAAGIVFEENDARTRVMAEIDQLAGHHAAEALRSVQQPAARAQTTVATTVGGITLVIGALSVFKHLQDALNLIWRRDAEQIKGWRLVLKRRVFSFGLVVVTGLILLISLIVSATLSWAAQKEFLGSLGSAVGQGLNLLTSYGVATFLFATVFKVLPDAPVRWREVWFGAAVTAALFTAGKYLLGVYLARASAAAAYGAAGSVITLLLWTYYAAQIVLLGAEFTRIQAVTHGGRTPLPREEKQSRKTSRATGKA
jgi:membrane protein